MTYTIYTHAHHPRPTRRGTTGRNAPGYRLARPGDSLRDDLRRLILRHRRGVALADHFGAAAADSGNADLAAVLERAAALHSESASVLHAVVDGDRARVHPRATPSPASHPEDDHAERWHSLVRERLLPCYAAVIDAVGHSHPRGTLRDLLVEQRADLRKVERAVTRAYGHPRRGSDERHAGDAGPTS